MLIRSHYSPSLVRPEEALEEAAKVFPNTIAARDRQSVELQFEDGEGDKKQ